MLPAYVTRQTLSEDTPPSAVAAYDDEIAPSYDPGVQLAPTYKINSSFTPPLVTTALAKAHLDILSAFGALRNQVISAPSEIDANMREDVKWALFLTRAAFRFDTWVRAVVNKQARQRGDITLLLDTEIPPLDVCR